MSIHHGDPESFIGIGLSDGSSRFVKLSCLSMVMYDGDKSRFNHVCISPESGQASAQAAEEPEYILEGNPYFYILAGIAEEAERIQYDIVEVPATVRSAYGVFLSRRLSSPGMCELNLLAIKEACNVYDQSAN